MITPGKTLAAFDEQRRERAAKMAAMLDAAGAAYLAQTVRAAADHVELALKANRPLDATDTLYVHDAVQVCGGPPHPDDEVLCQAVLKRIPRNNLLRLAAKMAGRMPAR